MPTPAEYAEAAEYMETCLAGLSQLVKSLAGAPEGERYKQLIAHDTLALRCLRVVAAMEARSIDCLSANPSAVGADDAFVAERLYDGWFDPMRYEAPDPLTAAERAMGVGT